MRGWAFDNLPALQEVNLESNLCIDQEFKKEEEIREISKTVNATCGVDKTETQISCEYTHQTPESLIFCFMGGFTAIKDIGYTISDPFDDMVGTINFNNNRKIEFLPILLHSKFPNLQDIFADNCAIREISKENFEKLHHLETISLPRNQIYVVLSDTFEGLASLSSIDLSEFNLGFMKLQNIIYLFSFFTLKQVKMR